MLNTFLEDTLLNGNMALAMDISMRGYNWHEMIRSMDGYVNLSGKNLTMYGFNADKVIKEFQRSQNFNLVDAGAVLLAGPVGLVVTKGSDFARLLITNPGESSSITQLTSNWKADDGVLTLEDVAFATNKNRVAAKGWISIVTDSLDVSFAVLNESGCSILTQDLFGSLDKPAMGKVKVMKTLFAPVTNLYNDIVGNDCVKFYTGTVEQPVNK
jgi:AsmA protein